MESEINRSHTYFCPFQASVQSLVFGSLFLLFGCGVQEPLENEYTYFHPYYETNKRPLFISSVGLVNCSQEVKESYAVDRFTYMPEYQRECEKITQGVGGMSCFNSSRNNGYQRLSKGQNIEVCAHAQSNPRENSAEQIAFEIGRVLDSSAKNLQQITGRKESEVPRVNVEIAPNYRSVELSPEKEQNGRFPAHYMLNNMAYFYQTNTIAVFAPSARLPTMLWKHDFPGSHEYGHAIEYNDVRDGLCEDEPVRGKQYFSGHPNYDTVKELCKGVREAVADFYGIFLSNKPVHGIDSLVRYGYGRNPFRFNYFKGYKASNGQRQASIKKTFNRKRMHSYLTTEETSRTQGNPVIRDSHFLGSVFAHHWLNAILAASQKSNTSSTADLASWVVPITEDFTRILAKKMRKTHLGHSPEIRATAYIRMVNDSFAGAITRHQSKVLGPNVQTRNSKNFTYLMIARGFTGI